MRHLMILGGLLVLGACGDSDVANDIPATTNTVAVNAAAPTVTPTAASQADGSGWPGIYQATFEGGSGEIRIAAAGADGRHPVTIELAAAGCTGKADSLASPAGNTLVLTLDKGDDARVCQIGITRDGDSLDIEERNCLGFHGAGCSFAGSALRKGSPAAAPADQPGNTAQ